MHIALVQTRYHGGRCKRLTRLYRPASPFRADNGNFRHGDARYGVACRPVQACGLFTPTQGLYFWALLSPSYLLICILHSCKPCTIAIGSLDVSQISIVGLIRRCLGRGTLLARTGLWAFCTYTRIIFLGSPFP